MSLPQAVWSGSFYLFGVEVKCHTLSDGQRIIEADSFHNLMDAMSASAPTIDDYHADAMQGFAQWRAGR